MRNYIQPGNVLTAVTPNGGVSSGDPVLIGNLFGIASTTQAAGEDVELAVTGVFDLPKAAPLAVTAGAVAYYDATAGNVTTDDDTGANKRIGVFVAAAADVATIGRVRLDGSAT